jgi:hypothetical protein
MPPKMNDIKHDGSFVFACGLCITKVELLHKMNVVPHG